MNGMEEKLKDFYRDFSSRKLNQQNKKTELIKWKLHGYMLQLKVYCSVISTSSRNRYVGGSFISLWCIKAFFFWSFFKHKRKSFETSKIVFANNENSSDSYLWLQLIRKHLITYINYLININLRAFSRG